MVIESSVTGALGDGLNCRRSIPWPVKDTHRSCALLIFSLSQTSVLLGISNIKLQLWISSNADVKVLIVEHRHIGFRRFIPVVNRDFFLDF